MSWENDFADYIQLISVHKSKVISLISKGEGMEMNLIQKLNWKGKVHERESYFHFNMAETLCTSLAVCVAKLPN